MNALQGTGGPAAEEVEDSALKTVGLWHIACATKVTPETFIHDLVEGLRAHFGMQVGAGF